MNIQFCNITLDNKKLKHLLKMEDLGYSDDELLHHAYKRWEDRMVFHLDGDFSFVLYDLEKKYYFCARDPLGVKSFYFTEINGDYKFSSNIDELFILTNKTKIPNLKSMRSMLYEQAVDYSDTMYEGIYRLPPGHFMTIKNGHVQIERYWYPEKIKRNYLITEEEATKKLYELLSRAINKRVSELEECAFEVSGGLDSSSIVSLLTQSMPPEGINSYTLNLNELKCDESEYVESILNHYPLHHQKISGEKLNYREKYSLSNLYKMSPNWPINLTFAMGLPMYEKIKNDGGKIVITGQGGDHIFTGNQYVFYDLLRRFKFLTLYDELKIYSKPWHAIKSYIIKPFLGKNIVHFMQLLLRKAETNPFINQKSEIQNLTQRMKISDLAFKNDLDFVTSACHSTVMDGNLFHCVEDHFNIEFRHPFFDLALVEFALSLPPEFKFRNGKIKWILRKAMKGILPDKIIKRKDKAEFSEIITQQIDAIDLGTLLDNPYIVQLGLIDKTFIDKYRNDYENRTIKNILILWRIINMEYWYRYNFHKESIENSKSEKNIK